ncbi:hypothetical protein BGZ89_004451 [Linnemannia elongata]|nr:hypothetical protein BGZ89_004451 [Linnemannia elongata]
MDDIHDSPSPLPSNVQELYSLIHSLVAEVQELKAHRDRHSPYNYAEPEAPVQKLVFDETREALYPNGVASAQTFFKRTDSSQRAIAGVTAEVSKRLHTLPQNPHQVYSAPAAFEEFPGPSREKQVDTALSSLQSHLAHLTRPIDHLAFEVMENHRVWSYRDEDGNINQGLQGYESIEDFANHAHEIYEEQTTSLLAALNDYRGYLADLSHRISDIRLNLSHSAISKGQQEPPTTIPTAAAATVRITTAATATSATTDSSPVGGRFLLYSKAWKLLKDEQWSRYGPALAREVVALLHKKVIEEDIIPRKYFQYQWNGRQYQFRVLPFSSSLSSLVFTEVLKPSYDKRDDGAFGYQPNWTI